MHSTGKIYMCADTNQSILLTLVLDKSKETSANIDKLKDKDIVVDIEKLDGDHTPSQRKYFHKLCSMLAKKERISMQRCKNELLAECGILDRLEDGNPIILKMNVAPDLMLEHTSMHLDFIKYDNDGYFYKMLKPTSEMTTSEYNELIDITIYHCRTKGIQTDTPEELARLKALWGN